MYKKSTILAILLISIFSLVSSAGVSSPYWEDNSLYMDYGETKTFNLTLQNVVGNEPVTVNIEIKEGSEIASLEETTYTANPGTADTRIPITVTIPEDYSKSVQRIELKMNTVLGDQGGTVSLGTGWTTSFNVIISEPETGDKTNTVSVLLLVAAIIILLVIIFLKYQKKGKHKRTRAHKKPKRKSRKKK